MPPKRAGRREQAINIGRGLFLCRYVSAGDTSSPPSVVIDPASAVGGPIQVMAPPGAMGTRITRPGECLVVRSEAVCRLVVAVEARGPNSSVEAKVEIKPLITDDLEQPAESTISSPVLSEPVISVMAHIARRGDVKTTSWQWLAGPEFPSPIEGLAIDWQNRPSGVSLRYHVTLARNAGPGQAWVDAGSFAGTRRKATPLVAAAFELGDEYAAFFQIRAEALFLGAAPITKVGRSVRLTGPSGSEPLVGLRLSIDKVGAKTMEPSKAPNNNGDLLGERRVRVFRNLSR